MRKQIDLTTLPGWANLSSGNHTIKIKAKGTGYIDSELSAGVVVNKAPSTVTLEAGTYKFVDNPTLPTPAITENFSFMSSNTSFDKLIVNINRRIAYSVEGDTLGVYYNNAWTDTAYQTITLATDQQVSAEFYKWAITDGNLVKQVEPSAYTDCLTFTGESSEFTLKASNKTWDGTLEWSTDHNTWTTLTGTEEMQSVGKKLYLRGNGNTKFYANYTSLLWQLSAKAGCSGNIQTLIQYDNPPAIISENGCYTHMFKGCTNLTAAPELSATTLTRACYNGMFTDCTNLTTAPELPATTLTPYCYYNMFYGCTKLKVNTSSGNKIFTCPSTIPSDSVSNMFVGTGGSFTGTPTAGNTYYWTE